MPHVPLKEHGTPKHIALQLVVDAWDPDSTPDTLVVTLCCVPKNTKVVSIAGTVKANASGYEIEVREFDTDEPRIIAGTKIANQNTNFRGHVDLNSNLQFYVRASNAAISEVNITVTEVWI
ncbi:hypothetical protein ES703_52859 [subsurface metagenome]